MDNIPVLTDLLYIGEHLTCSHYKVEVGSGFVYREPKQGSSFGSVQTQSHQLLIVLSGHCSIRYGQFPERELKAKEMILIKRLSEYRVTVLKSMTLLIMSFDAVLSGCDKLVLDSYYPYRANIVYDFKPTPIRHPLLPFFDLLLYYLRNGMSCAHLHEMKHKELFLCLRGYYTKEELTYLLYELIEKTLDFRKFIYENHKKVKTAAELIQLSNMSTSAFIRRFKQEFACTPSQWLQKRKCEQIMWYAVSPEITVEHLVETFGYASVESFCNFCKANFGCTPKQLIERSRNVGQI